VKAFFLFITYTVSPCVGCTVLKLCVSPGWTAYFLTFLDIGVIHRVSKTGSVHGVQTEWLFVIRLFIICSIIILVYFLGVHVPSFVHYCCYAYIISSSLPNKWVFLITYSAKLVLLVLCRNPFGVLLIWY
jgi:hypothetical protein